MAIMAVGDICQHLKLIFPSMSLVKIFTKHLSKELCHFTLCFHIDEHPAHAKGDVIKAGSERLGLQENLDFNGESQIGYGKYAVTKSDGLRNDTGTAFLRLVFVPLYYIGFRDRV